MRRHLKALPKLDNESAMADRGRMSALMSARNEACEQLRDVVVAVQHVDVLRDDIGELMADARAALERLEEISKQASEWIK